MGEGRQGVKAMIMENEDYDFVVWSVTTVD